MSIAITLHILAATAWVGGMFFAYLCLRPVAASLLPPPQRLLLWRQVFQKFFFWVWLAVALLIVTGHAMIGLYGGMAAVGTHVHIMLATGYLMILLFVYLFFVPYRHLQQTVSSEAWPLAGQHLNRIRRIVAINLGLGLFTVANATGGRFLY